MNKCPKEDMKERYELIMSLTGELDKKLKELPDLEIITEDEFQKKKKELPGL